MTHRAADAFTRLIDIMATLRGPDGCPWDREQTIDSLKPFVLEETYEVLEAIDQHDHAGLCEELGDFVFEAVFLAQLESEAGHFEIADSLKIVADKLVRRHPHVFGDVVADSAETVLRNWDEIKRAEKGRSGMLERGSEGVFEGIPGSFPALSYAHEVQKKAAHVGFDWPDVDGAFAKIAEEAAELGEAFATAEPDAARDELGDLLFAVVNVARHLDIDPESALRAAAQKFRKRFGAVEVLARARGIELATAGLDQLDALWDEVKQQRQ
jgi:tetrapyrrole methylase family protein/MazG family protein